MGESMDGRLSGGRLLEGYTALVTGGASGIGRGIAEVLRERGTTVAITGLIDVGYGEVCAAGLLAYPLGVQDHQAYDGAVVRAVSDLGKLSVLASNVGVYPQIHTTDTADEDISAIFGVSVIGAIHIVQAAAVVLRESRRGRVVVTSPITGDVTGYPGWPHYGTTKAVQMGFVRSVAMELARDGITINTVMPGNVTTPSLVALGKEYMRWMVTAVPLGCLGESRDIGEVVASLASDGTRYITGQAIVVDGGQILPGSPETVTDM